MTVRVCASRTVGRKATVVSSPMGVANPVGQSCLILPPAGVAVGAWPLWFPGWVLVLTVLGRLHD